MDTNPVVVIAMDSFKGCIGSLEAASIVAEGIRSVHPEAEIRCLPVADGGEGTVEAIAHGMGGSWVSVSVAGPLGAPVEARYLTLPDGTAILELASASGLPLLSERERNPMRTNTFGTGEMLRDALDRGYRKLMLGVGGSATNDGGVGIAQALGVRFYDTNGDVVSFDGASGNGGGALGRIARMDVSGLHPAVREASLTVACDVSNPLCGPLGASHVFGPQKGATPDMVRQLDDNLGAFAARIRELTGVNVADLPGSGAAGGVNTVLVPLCGAVLRPGIQWVLEAVGLQTALEGATLVVTGEGRMDGQSIHGKAPVGVASIAKEHGGLPVCAIVGDTGPEVEAVYACGIDRILKLRKAGMSVEASMAQVRERLYDAGARIGRECLAGCERDANGPMEA